MNIQTACKSISFTGTGIHKLLGLLLLCGLCWGCSTPKLPISSEDAQKVIAAYLVEQGNQDGGNRLDIHSLEIKEITAESLVNVEFSIDFTRYPTAGLSPAVQQKESIQRQTEEHTAQLRYLDNQWRVEGCTLR